MDFIAFSRLRLATLLIGLTIIASSPSSRAITLTSIQNATSYSFTLTNVTLSNSSCTPSCIPSLAPNAIQLFHFLSSTSYIIFDYDILSSTKKIGSISIKASPSSVNIVNGLGATIISTASTAQIKFTPPSLMWKGSFSSATSWRSNNWNVSTSLPSWGSSNIQVKTTLDSPKQTNYLRILYPKGSANPGASPPLPLGGTQFYGSVINTIGPITLSYYIRFPVDFPFLRSSTSTLGTLGKLPGLYSGTGNTGDNIPTGKDGWTIRFMWCDYARETGTKLVAGGEIAQFTYQSDKGLYSSSKGKFIGCGTWKFVPDGKWHNIQQTIRLNDPGIANGRIDVCYDNKLVYTVKNVMFRTVDSLKINGIIFQSFFGGSGSEYATPTSTYADFADFAIYSYPASAPPGLCVTGI